MFAFNDKFLWTSSTVYCLDKDSHLENWLCCLNETWQLIRKDLTVHVWADLLPWSYSVGSEMLFSELVYRLVIALTIWSLSQSRSLIWHLLKSATINLLSIYKDSTIQLFTAANSSSVLVIESCSYSYIITAFRIVRIYYFLF